MNATTLHPIIIITVSFLLSLLLTVAIRNLLFKLALLDHPNHRSSHTDAVPRGAGWALLLVILPCVIGISAIEGYLLSYVGVITAVALLGIVSWLDDRHGLNPLVRLGTHILAAFLGTTSFDPSATLFDHMVPLWIDRTILILGWAWFINIYNFMDGIDGITAVETISLALGTCLFLTLSNQNDPFISTLTMLLIGSCLGFLALNWHPAKIFLGDIGSVPLGFLTGFMLLTLALKGHPLAALILPLYYLADGGITLIKRILRGEKFWQAHRQHFYQKAAAVVRRHDRVVFWIILTNISLIVCALFSLSSCLIAPILAAAIVTMLLLRLHKMAAKT